MTTDIFIHIARIRACKRAIKEWNAAQISLKLCYRQPHLTAKHKADLDAHCAKYPWLTWPSNGKLVISGLLDVYRELRGFPPIHASKEWGRHAANVEINKRLAESDNSLLFAV